MSVTQVYKNAQAKSPACCNSNCRQGRDCPMTTVINLPNIAAMLISAAMLAAPVLVYVIRTGGFV